MRAIFNFLVGKPGRVTRLGEFVGFVGYFLSLAALFSRMPGMVVAAFHGSTEFRTLSELYPSWPLWWVPESGASIILALLICAAALYLRSVGHKVDRLYGVEIEAN